MNRMYLREHVTTFSKTKQDTYIFEDIKQCTLGI